MEELVLGELNWESLIKRSKINGKCTRRIEKKTWKEQRYLENSNDWKILFSGSELDLLTAVKIPFEDQRTQYVDEEGTEGFPAFGFKTGSDVKAPYRIILPEKMFPDFAILAKVKPTSASGGYIFAVVNPYETVIQLGLMITRDGAHSNISFLYTDPSHLSSNIIANFTVDDFTNYWTRFAIKVHGENITLYFNCVENVTVTALREPRTIIFDSASTLYIAKAGSKIQQTFEASLLDRFNFSKLWISMHDIKCIFQGSIDQLKIFNDPEMAADQCNNEVKVTRNVLNFTSFVNISLFHTFLGKSIRLK